MNDIEILQQILSSRSRVPLQHDRSCPFVELKDKQAETNVKIKERTVPEDIQISMFEVVGGPLCVASNDGQKVYERLAAALKADRHVTLSFRKVTTLTAAFLNAAVGQLYGTFSEEKIRSLLKVKDVESVDLALLKRVVDNAKLYFKSPQRIDGD